MRFIYGKDSWRTYAQGEEHCYLITNGLGGYSSLTAIASNARNDHALLMASARPPSERYHLVTNILLQVCIDDKIYDLSSACFASRMKNRHGYKYLQCFDFEFIPRWQYQAGAVSIVQTVFMKHNENTVVVQYEVEAARPGKLVLTPQFQFVPKGKQLNLEQIFTMDNEKITSGNISLYYKTNGSTRQFPVRYDKDLYYWQDACDGRETTGCVAENHNIQFSFNRGKQTCFVVYSMESVSHVDELWAREEMENELSRCRKLADSAGFRNDVASHLAFSASQYLALRQSTGNQSVIAGFPFFGDWGRDTMIALAGCTLCTGRYESAKSILRTFMSYCRRGLMPNMFPDYNEEPLYNTVDASLLFIEDIYLYYKETGDLSFVQEAWHVMEDIIYWYVNGTDYNIYMDKDGLVSAGEGLYQLTWMDVRIGDILPTPRHGKPVEINAYWYNALMVMAEFAELNPGVCQASKDYKGMAEHTKNSFLKLFWCEEKGYLKDFISSGKGVSELDAGNQIRCNQIWALSMSFTMVDEEQAVKVLETVWEHLYTAWGLRSLSPSDAQYHGTYGGPQPERDMAYHQGTVWTYPLGAYYRAVLRWLPDKKSAAEIVYRQLAAVETCLREGCAGHIAEIYDGDNPDASRGCFAQAWSVGEILRVYAELEKMEV